MLAGGVESMTRAPYVQGKADRGLRPRRRDLRHHDRLALRQPEDEVGSTASIPCRRPPRTSRRTSRSAAPTRTPSPSARQQRAGKAQASGRFAEEIVAVDIPRRKGDPVRVEQDEHPRPDTTLEALAKLPTPFRKEGGSVTAGNASGVNDGAAALHRRLRGRGEEARPDAAGARSSRWRRPASRRASWASARPRRRGSVLEKAGLKLSDIDVIELNEAFAAQALAVTRDLGLPDDAEHVNPNGGAIALGHPLGMSGARLVHDRGA